MKNRRITKNKCKKKSRLLYRICVAGMLVLFAVALFLPQIIFAIQDRYQMSNIELQARNSLDISQLNLAYERDLNERLHHFFDMEGSMITAIDYEFTKDSEIANLLETIFTEEWFTPIYYNFFQGAIYVYTTDYVETLAISVADCKKYLIYSGDYQDGIALMMWYVDLNLVPVDARVRLLIDTESHTVYYMKIIQEGYNMDKENDNAEMLKMVEIINSYYDFYYNYYEADTSTSFTEYETDNGSAWYKESAISENECKTSFQLPYGELSVGFLFQTKYRIGNRMEIVMGIPAIGEKIPEMIQD